MNSSIYVPITNLNNPDVYITTNSLDDPGAKKLSIPPFFGMENSKCHFTQAESIATNASVYSNILESPVQADNYFSGSNYMDLRNKNLPNQSHNSGYNFSSILSFTDGSTSFDSNSIKIEDSVYNKNNLELQSSQVSFEMKPERMTSVNTSIEPHVSYQNYSHIINSTDSALEGNELFTAQSIPLPLNSRSYFNDLMSTYQDNFKCTTMPNTGLMDHLSDRKSISCEIENISSSCIDNYSTGEAFKTSDNNQILETRQLAHDSLFSKHDFKVHLPLVESNNFNYPPNRGETNATSWTSYPLVNTINNWSMNQNQIPQNLQPISTFLPLRQNISYASDKEGPSYQHLVSSSNPFSELSPQDEDITTTWGILTPKEFSTQTDYLNNKCSDNPKVSSAFSSSFNKSESSKGLNQHMLRMVPFESGDGNARAPLSSIENRLEYEYQNQVNGNCALSSACYSRKHSVSAVNTAGVDSTPTCSLSLSSGSKQKQRFSKSNLGARNKPLNETAISIMESWYAEHASFPYPTTTEKRILSQKGGISLTQVASWFANRRNRSDNTRPKKNLRRLRCGLGELSQEIEETSGGLITAGYVTKRLKELLDEFTT